MIDAPREDLRAMRGTAKGAILLVGAVALGAACGGNGNTETSTTGTGSSGGSPSSSSGGSGDTSGSSGSSSGGSGFTGSADSSVSGSDDGASGGSTDTGASDGESDASRALDTGSGDGAQNATDGSAGGSDAGADAGSTGGTDAGSTGGTDAGSTGGTDAGSTSGADAGSTSGADAGHDGGNADASNGSTPTMIPTPTATCPTISNTGTGSEVLTYAGHSITVWAGATPTTPGPLVIYWYATAGSPAQAVQALGQAGIDKITSLGGVVVAPNSSTTTGSNTGDFVWYTGDVAQVDEVVACAVQQHRVDPRHIHVLGYSAGALQTVYMWYARSGYVASVLSYSGGDVTIDTTTMQDPSNIPPAVVAHGAMGMDTFATVDFYTASHTWETDIKNVNGFDIDCNDGSTHTDETTRFKIAPEGVQFFLDHPFMVSPDPYANGLPSGWPSYCTIANK
jgi:hypothetical protein